MATQNSMSIEHIAVEDIRADAKFNARRNIGDIEDLVASIGSIGMQQPMGAQRVKGGFRLVYGFRRLEAAKEVGFDTVPCVVYPTSKKIRDLMLLNLQENVVRQSLNPMDEAVGVERLLKKGFDETEVKDALGWSQTLLTQRLGLLEMTEQVQEGLRDDRITVSQARAITQLPDDRHERFVDVASALTTQRLKELVDRELEKINRAQNPELAGDDPGDGDGDGTEPPEGGDDKIDPVLLSS